MRHAVLALALAFPLVACAADAPSDENPAADAPSDEDPAADATAAEAALASFFTGLEAYDFDAVRAAVTSDFELVEDTLIMDVDEFVAFVEPFQAQGTTMTFELSDHNTEVDGDVAWTRYVNRAVMTAPQGETRFHWLESAVFTRQPDGAWKIDRLQSTPVRIEGAMAEGG